MWKSLAHTGWHHSLIREVLSCSRVKKSKEANKQACHVFVLSLSALDSGCEANSCLMLLP